MFINNYSIKWSVNRQWKLIHNFWHYYTFVPSLRRSLLKLFSNRVQCNPPHHYDDVIMGEIASQITSLTIVYSTVYSGADQSKHQSSTSLAFVWGIHRGPVNSPHKWPVTRKMFPFDDVIMLVHFSAVFLKRSLLKMYSSIICSAATKMRQNFSVCCALLWLHVGQWYGYHSELLHWSLKQTWTVWINKSHTIKNDTNTTKQNTPK